jgi:hypothetical protein
MRRFMSKSAAADVRGWRLWVKAINLRVSLRRYMSKLAIVAEIA